ncbi:flagellar hook-basal body complex protein [Clostridiaceae bacterium 35-E11]
MLRGLYTATSAMQTNGKRMDVITNNIANINTTGYKKDLVLSEAFPEVLIKKINSPLDFSAQEAFEGVEVQQDNGGYYVSAKGGYFRTQTMNGVSHQKELKFAVNKDGYLSTYYRDQNGNIDTDEGYMVLGNKGPIYVGNGALEINPQGQVMVGGNVVDRLITFTAPNVIGTLNAGVRMDKIQVNYEQGHPYQTDNQLDFTLKGPGFFQVQTPDGIAYTRDGSFKLNNNNELVTSEGYAVLGKEGPVFIEGTKISVSESGVILADEVYMDQLDIVDITNIKDLRKQGDNLYRMAEQTTPQIQPFTGQVLQGFLEQSNVNPIKEMVQMITLFRNYESNQRMIKAYDDTIGKAVNEVGKV